MGFALVGSASCYRGGELCEFGVAEMCVGPENCAGERACNADGSFGECLCAASTTTGGAGEEPQSSTSSVLTTTSGGLDEPASGSTGATGSIAATTLTGTTGPCVEVTCEEGACGGVPSLCGGPDVDCGACSGEFGCAEGRCVLPCEERVVSLTNGIVGDPNYADCGFGTKSVMYIKSGDQSIAAVTYYQSFDIHVQAGEDTLLTVECCQVGADECASLMEECESDGPMMTPCTCATHDLVLSGDSCVSELKFGCE